ncbi:LysR substrate-binding domain-containing protein [Tropicimonas sp. IMCC6043]|uniref:LysR substrate-binding domain-containing protein n=1 Tax=Tropicimonas sp. IMCC6043 TaxID=2510645 RepID=UPI00101D5744|nr:LysR substrate-binding domain-containing protein [Tropicimonas sp. IMCC6043]RYH08422.1 LysR family transcriptional regulator [Tropicimonas sp. IMCC6043]
MTLHATPQIPLVDLDLLRTLDAIAESGSFSAAAGIVHRTPSAVSMQVRRLEEIVGRPVFLRDSRSVSLTADGEFLLAHARRMLAFNRKAMAHFIAPELRGTVRLGAPDDVIERFLPPMLRRFAESHPCVVVDVVVNDSHNIRRSIQKGALDIALVTDSSQGAAETPAEEVLREPLVWASCACGVAAGQDPLPVSVWNEGCAWRNAGLAALDRAGRRWRIALQSAHLAGQRAAVLADLAVAPIPAAALGGRIVEAPPAYKLPPLPSYSLGMIVARDAEAPILAAADHLRASFAKCGA